jgi:hypothetical protein
VRGEGAGGKGAEGCRRGCGSNGMVITVGGRGGFK